MSTPIVRVEDVWKAYQGIASFQLKGVLLGKEALPEEAQDWALKGISFEVPRGESFGIIGHNGSGKTTLLSLLLGAIRQTRGEIEVHGRVASLLELGSGFHVELSGRDNIHLYASILGMRRAQIEESFERIVDFAELWDVIDDPVRTYSAGMNARLGFATIIHVPVDILLVDEILGVGDEHFREKCSNFFREFKERGGTLVTVSHSLGEIESLCERGLYMRRGEGVLVGPMSDVVARYLEEIQSGQALRE